ncbi:ABC-type Fe3+/spermidine/putrescine transport system ATPase subunit [Hoeflea marina]|uniref:ABC-type Fe3+/spermidine/putrescine transport system ATPase subunit n=1 Tax=Hoeflea marina TaxID=274592 RepID=A0A317PEV7_9HYPH|nr:ABC transporter ATP-binding protein [Hoeflea marina]PWV98228.1 ABC-type Fe3+/spermidine/putrescine transport system ATPase subunit [Hoeflea marina]
MFDLECENLVKRFGPFTAVDGVSLEIPSGSFFSILGPSGCGKTTLMRMIAGFENPNSGDIRLKGKSVVTTPPNKRNVKMVFQHLALFPMMNVGENIAYGLRCRGENKADITAKVASVLERISMPGVQEKQISQLSGGQKQRIAIARCMVLNPDVLLLDEPLGALDLKLREHMKIELKQLQSQFDTTFLYITHDQSEALVMSDNVAVMNGGRFEQIGAPETLYHAPKTAFVAGFVGDSNRWSGTVSSIAGDLAKVTVGNGLEMVASIGGARPQTGGEVEVFVRPEAMQLLAKGAATAMAAMNTLDGVVDSLLFNGAASRVLVRTQAGLLIEVVHRMDAGQVRVNPGDAVTVGWAHGAGLCFRVGG